MLLKTALIIAVYQYDTIEHLQMFKTFDPTTRSLPLLSHSLNWTEFCIVFRNKFDTSLYLNIEFPSSCESVLDNKLKETNALYSPSTSTYALHIRKHKFAGREQEKGIRKREKVNTKKEKNNNAILLFTAPLHNKTNCSIHIYIHRR